GWGHLLRGLGEDFGFVKLTIGACAVLYGLSLLADPASISARGMLGMLSPGTESLVRFGASGAVPVFLLDRWWTVLSASWLHGSLLHILFNMLWVRQLGPATARLYGPGRMVLIYVVGGAAGFILSSTIGAFLPGLPGFLRGARLTIGASASIFGLLGALVYYGRRGPSAVGQQAWSWALVLFLFGFLMPGIDNFAHLGGFGGGYLTAAWLNPLKPESQEQLVGALIALAASAVAVLASLAVPLPTAF
ncbi:MAG: rhomboid family intramembrane serine protease, partial [Thermoanaerobaculia bacterium]